MSSESQFGEVMRTHRTIWRNGGLVVEPLARPVLCLVSSDGKRAKERGEDFASVIARLPSDRLAFWLGRMRACYHERELIRREMERRRISTRAGDARGQMTLFPEAPVDD